MPETAMSCEEFEECLTDYLDGFLPAPLFHRWERHAAVCELCTKLPGEVVRSIGACYTYKGEELAVPAGLNERILAATLGDVVPAEVRAPFASRFASRLRFWLDPIMSPQLATVATMLLVAVFVLTSTVSADGSISGMYNASVQLAQQSKGVSGSDIKKFFVGGNDGPQQPPPPPASSEGTNVPDNKARPGSQKNDSPSEKPDNNSRRANQGRH